MHLNGMTDETRIDELIADLRQGPLAVRRAATAELGASGAAAVEPLIAAMLDGDNDLRWYAARALVQIGEVAIVPLLAAMRAGENRDFRRYAMAALAGIGEAAVEPLIDIIECADPALQPFAAMALMQDRAAGGRTAPPPDAKPGPKDAGTRCAPPLEDGGAGRRAAHRGAGSGPTREEVNPVSRCLHIRCRPD